MFVEVYNLGRDSYIRDLKVRVLYVEFSGSMVEGEVVWLGRSGLDLWKFYRGGRVCVKFCRMDGDKCYLGRVNSFGDNKLSVDWSMRWWGVVVVDIVI